MQKDGPKKHRKQSKHSRDPYEYKLLTYAALGQHKKIVRLLAKHPHLDVNFYDAQGDTALHKARQAGFCCINTKAAWSLYGCLAMNQDLHMQCQ